MITFIFAYSNRNLFYETGYLLEVCGEPEEEKASR